jgi:hypothetical protein
MILTDFSFTINISNELVGVGAAVGTGVLFGCLLGGGL